MKTGEIIMFGTTNMKDTLAETKHQTKEIKQDSPSLSGLGIILGAAIYFAVLIWACWPRKRRQPPDTPDLPPKRPHNPRNTD